MTRRHLLICDHCGHQVEALAMPDGWIAAKRKHFCSGYCKDSSAVIDVYILQAGDIVYYTIVENGELMIEKGLVKYDNLYNEGVTVYGEGWKQYVSKWFIIKVERGGEVVYEQV